MNWRKRTYRSHGFGGQIVFHFSGYSKSLLKPKKSRPSPFIFLSSNFSDRITRYSRSFQFHLASVQSFNFLIHPIHIHKYQDGTYLKLNWEEEMRTPSRFAGLTSSEMETPGFGELGERTCGYFCTMDICPFDNCTREICRFAPIFQRKVTFQSKIF